MKQKDKEHIGRVADEALNQFAKIADSARKGLRDTSTPDPGLFAAINTWTAVEAVRRLEQISQEKIESYEVLTKEPAIARVVAEDEDGRARTYYFCRSTPPAASEFPNLANYKTKAGRLASLPIGSDYTLPNGVTVVVKERALLRPRQLADGWDSRNSIVETEQFKPITVVSFRNLLEELARAAPTLLDQLLSEDQQKVILYEGVRHNVITKMGLRDQPVLDQYQDEIFRLPLNKRMVILGAPGTGKTTTLIRRLGQKLDHALLDEDEQRVVESVSSTNGVAHDDSWIMFTPTELLKQYLKEAFNREGVPASNLRINTWNDYRRELARNVLGVLRTASGGGTFVLKESIESLTPETIEHPIPWFSDFNEWQRAAFLQDSRQSAHLLSKDRDPRIAAIGQRLVSILERAAGNSLDATFAALAAEAAGIQALVTNLKEATDTKVKGALNLQVNSNRNFLDELARFIDELQLAQATDVDDEDDQEETEEEEEASLPRTGRMAAMNAYMQVVRGQARTHAAKRTLNKNSRNGKIAEWLGDRTLSEAALAEVGASLLLQTSARRFVNPVKRYISSVPRLYRAYRRMRQQENKWYTKDGFAPTDLHPLELDVIMLAILRGAGELLNKPHIVRDIEAPAWSHLKPVLGLYRNQIVVDEATDFSPIQLACMAALAHPRIRSFFACGDFNQRLTIWGSRSTDDLKWVFSDIDIKEITVSYRQSRQLNELARAIIRSVGGSDQNATLPEYVDNEGVAPALLESALDSQTVVSWLADQVREIERFVKQLPSTAVFVNSEAEVGPLAEALNANLADDNIRAVACHQGQVMGQDNDVRVFDIQHIKGLEFEAVFFISIDRLATLQPKLFDKYLYVGTTRAATYLGLTCEKALPAAISSLRTMFVPDWKEPYQADH